MLKIDIETCEHCGGAVKVLASIEDPVVIKQTLEHLKQRAAPARPAFRPFARAAANGMAGPKGTRLTVLPLLTHGREAGPDTRHGVTRACWSKRTIFRVRPRPQRDAGARIPRTSEVNGRRSRRSLLLTLLTPFDFIAHHARFRRTRRLSFLRRRFQGPPIGDVIAKRQQEIAAAEAALQK